MGMGLHPHPTVYHVFVSMALCACQEPLPGLSQPSWAVAQASCLSSRMEACTGKYGILCGNHSMSYDSKKALNEGRQLTRCCR